MCTVSTTRVTQDARLVSLQGKEVIIWEAASKAVKSSGMVFHQVSLCLVLGSAGVLSRLLRCEVEECCHMVIK